MTGRGGSLYPEGPGDDGVKLTGVEEDHGLQTHVLLPLQLELTKPRGGSKQHVEDLHDALHTLSLLPARARVALVSHANKETDHRGQIWFFTLEEKRLTEMKTDGGGLGQEGGMDLSAGCFPPTAS